MEAPGKRLVPVQLTGATVTLVPLAPDHYGALCQVLLEPALWRWTLHRFETRDAVSRYLRTTLEDTAAGRVLAFVITLTQTAEVVGSTRYHSIEPTNRRLEIGHTWVARGWQRTAVNTEAKYLLLRYAFEELGYRRVQFRAAADNDPSRRALLRIGAHEEGVLRRYEGGDATEGRDVVVFSILATEWAVVKASLEKLLARPET